MGLALILLVFHGSKLKTGMGCTFQTGLGKLRILHRAPFTKQCPRSSLIWKADELWLVCNASTHKHKLLNSSACSKGGAAVAALRSSFGEALLERSVAAAGPVDLQSCRQSVEQISR